MYLNVFYVTIPLYGILIIDHKRYSRFGNGLGNRPSDFPIFARPFIRKPNQI